MPSLSTSYFRNNSCQQRAGSNLQQHYCSVQGEPPSSPCISMPGNRRENSITFNRFVTILDRVPPSLFDARRRSWPLCTTRVLTLYSREQRADWDDTMDQLRHRRGHWPECSCRPPPKTFWRRMGTVLNPQCQRAATVRVSQW